MANHPRSGPAHPAVAGTDARSNGEQSGGAQPAGRRRDAPKGVAARRARWRPGLVARHLREAVGGAAASELGGRNGCESGGRTSVDRRASAPVGSTLVSDYMCPRAVSTTSPTSRSTCRRQGSSSPLSGCQSSWRSNHIREGQRRYVVVCRTRASSRADGQARRRLIEGLSRRSRSTRSRSPQSRPRWARSPRCGTTAQSTPASASRTPEHGCDSRKKPSRSSTASSTPRRHPVPGARPVVRAAGQTTTRAGRPGRHGLRRSGSPERGTTCLPTGELPATRAPHEVVSTLVRRDGIERRSTTPWRRARARRGRGEVELASVTEHDPRDSR